MNKTPIPIRCIVCGATTDYPGASWASWRRVEHEGEFYHACPREFPPATADAGRQRTALERFHLLVIRTVAAFKRKAGAH